MRKKNTPKTKGLKCEPSSVFNKLAALILLVSCSFSAHAYRLRDADVTVVNGVITQCTYDINSLGNIIEIPEVLDGQTITGLGDNCFQLAGKIKEVTLPATLKTIGMQVFMSHNLTHIDLPEGLISIGQNAFWKNNIEALILPNSITSINHGAFKENQIKTLIIPAGLTEISSEVFYSNKIEALTIPKNITKIGDQAFVMNSITNLTIPNTITSIGSASFSSNKIGSLIFEEGCKLTTIEDNCFSQNELKNVILPPTIKTIDRYAFANNYNLTSVLLPFGLQKIGKQAFLNGKLSSVSLPEDLIYLGTGAFKGNKISDIELPNQNMGSHWAVSDGTTKNNGDLISNFELSYIVPIPYTLKDEDVEVINGSIYKCWYTSNIENIGNDITIPSILDGQTVKEIAGYTFDAHHILAVNLPPTLKNISYGAFGECELTNLFIPASLETIGEYAFVGNNIESITFEVGSQLKTIDNYAFSSNQLTNVTIPQNVMRIGRYSFSNNKINSVSFEVPSNLINIEMSAFSNNNPHLLEIILPEPEVEGYAYQGWLDGNDIIHRASKNNLSVNDFSTYYRVLLSYTLTDDDVVVNKGVIISCSYDFTASMIIIPETLDGQLVIGISDYVFSKKGITSVTLPPKLKFVGRNAFEGNILSEITIPATTDSIAAYAFFGNYINNILYEENSVIRVIGSNAFRSNRLDTLIIPNTIERIESEAFEASQISYLAFEDGSKLTFLGENAFAYNNIQNNLTIPPLLKQIGKFAFRYNSIAHVTLHNNVTDIGEGAFNGNPSVTIDPLPTPETIPFVTWFIRWRDSDNNTLYPGYVITDFSNGYHALIDQYLNVKFQVYDDNGLVLEGANIQFSDSLMITDALGKDSIAPVMRGVHNYVVSANGCLTQTASVDVQDDRFLQVILNRLYSLNVKVVDKNNNPMESVHIEIGDSILQSNSQGEANLKLIDGNYICTISLSGYSGSANVQIHDADASITIQLNPAVITYHPNGGLEDSFSENATGSTYQIQNNSFTRLGYSFTNWNTQADGSGTNHAEGANLTLDPGDLDLFAIWQTNTYQISYDLRGGQNDSSNPGSYTINSPTILLKPAIATAVTGSYFEGWFDSEGIRVDSIPQGSTGDISLWASFIDEPSYTINYQNIMNGTHFNPGEYSRFDLPLAFQQASQNGYNFLGWYSDSNFSNKIESLTAGSKGDTILYARWESIIYDIDYVLNGGINSPRNPASYTIESNVISLQSASKHGYTFEGWFTDESLSQPATSIPSGSTGDKTFYAKWILGTYAIDYVLNGGENSPQNPANYTIQTSTITLRAPSKLGYSFEGWFADENFAQPVTSISSGSTGNKTFYAKWGLETYTIDYVLDGGTNSAQNPTTYTFESSVINLKEATKQGYTFDGWFADENFTQPVTSIPIGSIGNKTFYAKWISLYLLSFEITTDGKTPAPEVSIIVNNTIQLLSGSDGLVQLPCENDFQYSYQVVLDNIEITSGTGNIQSADQLVKVEIVNAYMRWFDVIFCDNSLQLWTDFEWQKSGQAIGREQFYHNEGGIENGQYTLVVTSQSGKQYVWTKNYQNNLFSLSYYPNPVLKSQELTVEINGFDEFNDCELLIYNSSGQVIHKATKVGNLNRIPLNSAIKEGVYLMVLTKKGKQLSSKQFIVR
ncbi:MAG TPA: leucine-rich repeat protein [Prolixibacteraceae bacterium]|nr:leucine-rich repeat protein [Prolixibacteraceae bacterium]